MSDQTVPVVAVRPQDLLDAYLDRFPVIAELLAGLPEGLQEGYCDDFLRMATDHGLLESRDAPGGTQLRLTEAGCRAIAVLRGEDPDGVVVLFGETQGLN